jgi:hypothetical protein
LDRCRPSTDQRTTHGSLAASRDRRSWTPNTLTSCGADPIGSPRCGGWPPASLDLGTTLGRTEQMAASMAGVLGVFPDRPTASGAVRLGSTPSGGARFPARCDPGAHLSTTRNRPKKPVALGAVWEEWRCARSLRSAPHTAAWTGDRATLDRPLGPRRGDRQLRGRARGDAHPRGGRARHGGRGRGRGRCGVLDDTIGDDVLVAARELGAATRDRSACSSLPVGVLERASRLLAVPGAAVTSAALDPDRQRACGRVVEGVDVDLGDAPVEPDRLVGEGE